MVEDAGNGTMSTSYNATKSGTGPDLLKPLTKPFTNLIVQVDKDVLIGWSFNVSTESSYVLSFLNCLMNLF